MTAYSYTDWNSKPADEQQNQPGISIDRHSVVNNPNRGPYWSPETAASALSVHIEQTLSGDDRVAAQRMWNGLKGLNRQATESPRMVDRAMKTRQADAHAALGNYNGDLDGGQLEQLTSVFDDVVSLQAEAQIVGVDPIQASRRMLQRAASRAVGYNMSDDRIEPEMRPLVQSDRGSEIIANMNQSVAQLQALMTDRPLEDAMDNIPQIGRDTDYTDDLREDHRRLNDILASVPLVLNPVDIEPERNFSVRMDSQQEATILETVVRWTGEQEQLPDAREIHRAFASWRDNGVAESPYSAQELPALGLVVGSSPAAQRNLSDVMSGFKTGPGQEATPLVVLAVDADESFRQSIVASGRTLVDVTAEADSRGVHLSSRGQDLPANRVELLNLSRDQAADPVERSLAVNAMVGRSDGVGYIAGVRMSTVEAQAIHLAGTLRKLNLGVSESGASMNGRDLIALRQEARDVDAAADPQRYYTAGNARPHRGVNAVAFESATKYDAANRANAPGRDLIGEAYGSIPKNTAILLVENKDNALNKWLTSGDNATDRKVLYAEANRTLSFAEIVGVDRDGDKRSARESETEFKIYDKPAAQRSYGYKSFGNEGEALEGHGNAASNKLICLDKAIEWDDPRVRGSIILVSGNAATNAINTSSQAVKVAQEAVMDRAHTALILSDMTDKRQSTDFHAAHMIRLAGEMGKKATVIDGRGAEMPLDQAREKTAHNAESYIQKRQREVGVQMTAETTERGRNSKIDVSAGSDLGQMALAALPGMSAVKAQRFAGSEMTLQEIRTDKSEEMRKALKDLGMPAKTRAVINDVEPWEKAMGSAIANLQTAQNMNATLAIPGDEHHPIEQSSGPTKTAVFTIGGYDFEKQPLAAFVGNSERFRQPGQALSLSDAQKSEPGSERGTMVDPADAIDRKALRESIREMTNKGYGIGVTLESGVSRAVIEEIAHVPDAKLVVVAPGNFMASSPEIRAAMRPMFEQDRLAVVMPTSISAHPSPEPKDGSERKPDTYIENRAQMQDMLATMAKVGVVVASSDKDQSLHLVRHLVEQEKPVAVMVPQDAGMAGTELYSGNTRLLRGKGKTHIESITLATAPSANAYAEISDDREATELVNGVRQGTAGSFQSARIQRSPMLRSGHMYSEFGWGAGAHPISGRESIERFVEKAEQGLGALGAYKEPTERELEAIRLKRDEHERSRTSSRVSAFVGQEFNSTSALHRTAVESDAERRIDLSKMDEERYKHVSGEVNAARQAAASGHSMN